MSTTFKLIIEDDEGKTTVYPLVDGEISIGRREGNTIRLMERNVSRRHARLVCDGDAVHVEDLDSYNGVRINGERIVTRHQVRERDLIEIGDYHLALQRADDEVAEQPTQNIDETEAQEATEAAAEVVAGWPAGTVPDFRLPDDLLSGAQLPREVEPSSGLPTERPHSKEPMTGETEATLPPFPASGFRAPAGGATVPDRRRAEALVREPVENEATRQLSRGPALSAPVPRLICVSTQYAGHDFPLDRSEVVIGRVEENDIVIEHRSVSRNHAKVHFDGRTHKIIDLQSANGILVNGEEYAMTNLRSGDLIELGHVRFRFVPAGEPFSATDEEAREMRENGVEPPREEAGAVPAFDLSSAATITDAPRSVVPDAPAPHIMPVNGERSPGRFQTLATGRTERVERADTLMESHPPHPSQAATAVVGAASLPTSEIEVEPSVVVSEASYPSGGLDLRKTLWILVGSLAVLVGALVLVLLNQGDERLDRRLEELFNQGSYAEVRTFFSEHESDFADPTKAAMLVGRAEDRLERTEELGEPEPDEESRDMEPLAAPGPASSAPEPSSSEEALVEKEPEAEEQSAAPSTARRSRATAPAAPKRRSRGRAAQLAHEAESAMLLGQDAKAERVLFQCVERYPAYPSCHRMLGVMYGQRSSYAKAIQHYERYLELAPDAGDAETIRANIRAFRREVQR